MSEQEKQRVRAAKAAKLSQQIDRAIRNAYKTSRRDQGLRQSDVADRMGWETSTVSNFEQGRTKLTCGEFAMLCRQGTDLDPVEVIKRGMRW